MIIKSTDKVVWYQGAGVHPSSFECNSCVCKYHIVANGEIEWFDDYQAAEGLYCALTGTKPFVLGKIKW